MSRIFNFSAGPAMLPAEVLARAGDEMLDWHGSGMSVMEMSHRGKEFIAIAAEAEADLRELLAIPANYKVLFLQGGATLQFAQRADEPAARQGQGRLRRHRRVVEEGDQGSARRYCEVNVAASSRATELHLRPAAGDVEARRRTRPTCTYCSERDHRRRRIPLRCPTVGDVPLVADMSSHILSRPIDVAKFGLIYAGAQKNIGPAGLTMVIVRDDLHRPARAGHARRCSTTRRRPTTTRCSTRRRPTRSTSPAWCSSGCKQQGGLAAIEQRNIAQGGAALRLPRRSRLLPATRWRKRRPLADERAVHAARRRSSTRRSSKGAQGARHGAARRATARSAACAPRSTTRCRSRACSALVDVHEGIRSASMAKAHAEVRDPGASTRSPQVGPEALSRASATRWCKEVDGSRRDPGALAGHAQARVRPVACARSAAPAPAPTTSRSTALSQARHPGVQRAGRQRQRGEGAGARRHADRRAQPRPGARASCKALDGDARPRQDGRGRQEAVRRLRAARPHARRRRPGQDRQPGGRRRDPASA